MIVYNSFGQDMGEFNESTSAERIGNRIREVRKTIGLNQAQLGEKIGINSDRVQKYENGARKPKYELLKQFAEALEVETLALSDPVVSNPIGAMYAFFEMEKLYGLKIIGENGRNILMFGDGITGDMNDLIYEWRKEYSLFEAKLEAALNEDERKEIIKEYDIWKWTFPKSISDVAGKSVKDIRIEKLKSQIELLMKELADLEKDK